MTVKHRIKALECRLIEAEIIRLREHMSSLPLPDLDLIIEIADSMKTGVWVREYTPAEAEIFNSHCDFMATIPDSVHDENTRQTLQELLAKGSIDRAEIIERWGPEYLPK